MLKTVSAKRFVRFVPNGSTHPHIISCSDGNNYYVKFAQNEQGVRTLVNEFVCGQLAALIGLPICELALVEIEKPFLNAFRKSLKSEVDVGLHFGSREIKKTLNVTNSKIVEQASNIHILPSLLLFDHWVFNVDRHSNKGNLLIDLETKKLVVIDHTHTFELGTIWNAQQLEMRIGNQITPLNMSGYVYHRIVPHITGNNPFGTALNTFHSVTESQVRSIIEAIPYEWGCTDDEREILLQYLMRRHSMIDEVPRMLQSQLPNWRGGVLR